MIILLFILSYFSLGTLQASSSALLAAASPHKNFAINTDGRISHNEIGNVSQIYHVPHTNSLIVLYDHYAEDEDGIPYFYKIDTTTGTESNPIDTEPAFYHAIPYGAQQILWGASHFVVPLYNLAACQDHGILSRYNYDLTLDTSFGTNGTTEQAIAGSVFITVAEHENKLYTGGIRNNAGTKGLIYRYTTEGEVDTTFGTDGYIELDHTSTIIQILPLKDFFVIKKIIDNDFVVMSAIPYEGPYDLTNNHDTDLAVHIALCTNLEKYDDHSFFVGSGKELRKYKVDSEGTITLDFSFNKHRGTALIDTDRDIIFQVIKKVGNYIFIGGHEQSADNFPKIICFNISSTTSPLLERSFYDEGLWDSSVQHDEYPGGEFGIQSLAFTTTSAIPSFFYGAGTKIGRVGIPSDTIIKNTAPKTYDARNTLLKTINKKIPLAF